MRKVLVTGSLAFDFIMDFPGKFGDHIDPEKIHILNVSFLINTLKKERGGTAANIAYSLALLNIPVGILGVVGKDFGDYADFLKSRGVDLLNLKTSDSNFTSQAFIVTDKDDNQISAFYPGAMDETPNLDIPQADFVVIAPNNPQAMVKFALACQSKKIPYLFDPGMQLPRLSNKQLNQAIPGAEILISNDYEIGILKDRLKVGDEELVKQVKVLIITLGDKGAMIKTRDQSIKIEVAKPQKALDPTGAGDAFRAGFLAGYFRKLDLKICGQMGALASCYAIEKYGTTTHSFSVEDFCKRYKKNYGGKLLL